MPKPFFKEGFYPGEKMFHILDAKHRDAYLYACREGGMDVVLQQNSLYVPPDEFLAALKQRRRKAQTNGNGNDH